MCRVCGTCYRRGGKEHLSSSFSLFFLLACLLPCRLLSALRPCRVSPFFVPAFFFFFWRHPSFLERFCLSFLLSFSSFVVLSLTKRERQRVCVPIYYVRRRPHWLDKRRQACILLFVVACCPQTCNSSMNQYSFTSSSSGVPRFRVRAKMKINE